MLLLKKKLYIKKIKFVNKYFLSKIRFIDVMRILFGLNYYTSSQVLRMLGLSLNIKIGSIDSKIIVKVIDFLINYLLIERGLKRFRNQGLMEKKNNGCIRGVRLLNGLPINGQRTHTNSKTVRKLFKNYKFED